MTQKEIMPEPPLVSVLVVAYQQEKYVRHALEGAFAQTYEPLEIVIVDDASNDGTLAMIRDYVAHHTGARNVKVHRNEKNLGIVGQVNRSLELCRGELVVIMAGDDHSRPERVSAIVRAYEASGRQADGFCSRVRVFDDTGHTLGVDGDQLREHPVFDARFYARGWSSHIGASEAWHRRVMEDFGPMDPQVPFEDVLLGFRAALRGGMEFVPEILVDYRRHTQNAFNRHIARSTEAESYCKGVARWARTIKAMQADLATARTRLKLDSSLIREAEFLLAKAEARATTEQSLIEAGRLRAVWRLLLAGDDKTFGLKDRLRMFVIHCLPPGFYGAFVRRNARRNALKQTAISAT